MGKTMKIAEELDLVPVRELSKAEGYELLDHQSRKALGMSAAEFIKEYDAGHLSNGVEQTKVMDLAMLIPFAR